MEILKNYKYFINEAVDSSVEIKSLRDVPKEVLSTTHKIIQGLFDKVKKFGFNFTKENGLFCNFIANIDDFKYINPSEKLKLDTSESARKKLTYDVELILMDAISETFEVTYSINFNLINSNSKLDSLHIQDDNWDDELDEKSPDDEYDEDFDEDLLDKKIKKGKIKLDDFDTDFLESEVDDEF